MYIAVACCPEHRAAALSCSLLMLAFSVALKEFVVFCLLVHLWHELLNRLCTHDAAGLLCASAHWLK